jgi:hypothetical protein
MFKKLLRKLKMNLDPGLDKIQRLEEDGRAGAGKGSGQEGLHDRVSQ